MTSLRRFLVLLSGLLVAVFQLAGCSAYRSSERSMSRMFYSSATESALGNQYHEEIQKEFTILDDPSAQAWVNRVGPELVANSPECSQEFKFYVTNSKEVNAFAIPGGHCYVNLGLILYSDNEAQVVAVVGHEVNHVTMRHGMMQLQRQTGVGLIATGAGVAFKSPAAQAAAVTASQAGGFLALQRFGRDDEREADKHGVEAMYKAGWDPREGVKFFEKLHALSGGKNPGMLDKIMSTHPPTTERIANLQKQIAAYDLYSTPLTVDSPEFEAMKKTLRAKYGDLEAAK